MYDPTVEGFQALIEECKALIEKLPMLPSSVACGLCPNGTARLDFKLHNHKVGNATWIGQHYFYKCKNCKQQFTTNESDTMSIATMIRRDEIEWSNE